MTRKRMTEHELDAALAEVGERLAYPRPTRLADAVRARLREPRAGRWWDALGAPDEVYRGKSPSGTHDVVTLVYTSRAGIPVSREAGVSALVVEFRGRVDESLFGKVAGAGTRIEDVTVNGGKGFWIEGEPHL